MQVRSAAGQCFQRIGFECHHPLQLGPSTCAPCSPGTRPQTCMRAQQRAVRRAPWRSCATRSVRARPRPGVTTAIPGLHSTHLSPPAYLNTPAGCKPAGELQAWDSVAGAARGLPARAVATDSPSLTPHVAELVVLHQALVAAGKEDSTQNNWTPAGPHAVLAPRCTRSCR